MVNESRHMKTLLFMGLMSVISVVLAYLFLYPYIHSVTQTIAFNGHYDRVLSKVESNPQFAAFVPELKQKKCTDSTNSIVVEMSSEWSEALLLSGLLLDDEIGSIKLDFATKKYVSCLTAYQTTKAIAERILLEQYEASAKSNKDTKQ